jgi:hypothetical protein
VRLQLNYLRGVSTYLVSYAYAGVDNALTIGKNAYDPQVNEYDLSSEN